MDQSDNTDQILNPVNLESGRCALKAEIDHFPVPNLQKGVFPKQDKWTGIQKVITNHTEQIKLENGEDRCVSEAWENLFDEWRKTFSEYPIISKLWNVTEGNNHRMSEINVLIGNPGLFIFENEAFAEYLILEQSKMIKTRKLANRSLNYYSNKLIKESLRKLDRVFPFWTILSDEQRLLAKKEFDRHAHLPDLEIVAAGVPDVVLGYIKGKKSIMDNTKELLTRLIVNALLLSEEQSKVLDAAFEKFSFSEDLFMRETFSFGQSNDVLREYFAVKRRTYKPRLQFFYVTPGMKSFIMNVIQKSMEEGNNISLFAPLNAEDFVEIQNSGSSLNKNSITFGLLLRGTYQYWLKEEWLVPDVVEQPFDVLVGLWNFAQSNKSMIAAWLKSLIHEPAKMARKRTNNGRFKRKTVPHNKKAYDDSLTQDFHNCKMFKRNNQIKIEIGSDMDERPESRHTDTSDDLIPTCSSSSISPCNSSSAKSEVSMD